MALGSGVPTGIVSGKPIGQFSREAMSKKIREKTLENYQELINDLTGDGGQVVQEIIKMIEIRINELIKNDGRCSALMEALSVIKYKINIGKVISEAQINGLDLPEPQNSAPERDTPDETS